MKRGVWIPITPDPATPYLRRVAAKLLRNGKYRGTKFRYYDPTAGWVTVRARESRAILDSLLMDDLPVGATDEEIAADEAVDATQDATQAAIVAAEEAAALAAAEAEALGDVVAEPIPDPAPEPVTDPVIEE